MISKKFAEHFAAEWIAAWNAHDLDRILSHYTEDFVLASPAIIKLTGESSGILKGKEAIASYCSSGAPTAGCQPMNIEPLSSLDEIIPVLTGCDLPVADISDSSPPQFFGFRVAGSVVAVIGLEQFQSAGLLRSLAVSPDYCGRGLAQELMQHVESFAASHGVESLFLLTTTAEAFFRKRGYCTASRLEAPQAIQATSQFSGLCPSSSAFLSKCIKRANPGVHTDSAPAALRR